MCKDGTKNKINFDLSKDLKDELTNMGFSNASIDENFIVTATLKNNSDSNKSIGLLAHYDTAEDAPNSNVKPQIRLFVKLVGVTS